MNLKVSTTLNTVIYMYVSLTNGVQEGFVESECENGFSEVGEKVLDYSTHHVHITHL